MLYRALHTPRTLQPFCSGNCALTPAHCLLWCVMRNVWHWMIQCHHLNLAKSRYSCFSWAAQTYGMSSKSVLHWRNFNRLIFFCLSLELFQADVDEFCQYYGTGGNSLCFPDFHRRQTRGPSSNYLDLTDDYEQKEDFNRFIWHIYKFSSIWKHICKTEHIYGF